MNRSKAHGSLLMLLFDRAMANVFLFLAEIIHRMRKKTGIIHKAYSQASFCQLKLVKVLIENHRVENQDIELSVIF